MSGNKINKYTYKAYHIIYKQHAHANNFGEPISFDRFDNVVQKFSNNILHTNKHKHRVFDLPINCINCKNNFTIGLVAVTVADIIELESVVVPPPRKLNVDKNDPHWMCSINNVFCLQLFVNFIIFVYNGCIRTIMC